MGPDLLTYIITAVGILLGFFVQTVIGFAAVLVALPIMIIVLDLQAAILILSILLALFSFVLIYQNFNHIQWKIIVHMGIFGFIGMTLGVMTLKTANQEVLMNVLGGFTMVYSLYSMVNKSQVRLFHHLGWLFGLIGGYFSGLFNTGGPMYVTYIINRLDDATATRATILGMLGIINIARIPIQVYHRMISLDLFFYSIVMLPVMFLAIYLGNQLVKVIDQTIFQKFILTVLFLVGLSLILT